MEHAFAALKGRFQSLRDLRQNINSADDLWTAVHWIQCCLILHNMIIRFEEEHALTEDQGSVKWSCQEARNFMSQEAAEGPDDNDQVGDRLYEGTPGHARHERLMDLLFDSPHSKAQHRQG